MSLTRNEEETTMDRAQLAKRNPRTELEALADWQNEADRKRRLAEAIRDSDRETIWAAFAAYMAVTRRKAHTSPETAKSYRRALADLLDWTEAGGAEGRMPHQLTAGDAAVYRAQLQTAGGRDGKPLAPASVNARLAGVRKFMGALVWAGLRDGDPFTGQGIEDRRPEEKRVPFSGTEVASLLAAATDPRDRAAVLLGADAGLRLSEAAGLTWGATDLGGRRLRVLGKGGVVRPVALTDRAAQALADLPSDREDGATVLGLSPRAIQHRFANLCEAAGVRRSATASRGDGYGVTLRRSFHSLRHSYGTRAHKAGVPLEVIGRQLGHRHLQTTLVYSKLDETDLLEAADRLGAADLGGRRVA
jgi:integrase